MDYHVNETHLCLPKGSGPKKGTSKHPAVPPMLCRGEWQSVVEVSFFSLFEPSLERCVGGPQSEKR